MIRRASQAESKTRVDLIHYIAFYAEQSTDDNFKVAPSAVTKIDYVLSVITRAGLNVSLFSTAGTQNQHWCHYKSSRKQVNDQFRLVSPSSFGSNLRTIRLLSRAWISLQLLLYLLFHVRSGEKVLVYHSPSYQWPIAIARLWTRFILIFEVEEIYSALDGLSGERQEDELRYLRQADGYLLVNDLMAERCKLDEKPAVIVYGSYHLPVVPTSGLQEDDKINIVYAGTIEKKRLDAFVAVNSAKYLPGSNYVLHVLGFGTPSDITDLKSLIARINEDAGCELAVYHGSKFGAEYSDFLQRCDIGLSTRAFDGDFVDLSFPSKLLVYLAHNIIPVCSSIPSVTRSRIDPSVVYYCENTPQSVADAIQSVDLRAKRDVKAILMELDDDFVINIKKMLYELDRQDEKNGKLSA